MSKYWLFYLLTFPLWGKPAILVSYYDAFSREPFNNSGPVALQLAKTINEGDYPFRVSLCSLHTIFDTAYSELQTCFRNDPEIVMYLGLGQGGCSLKIETMLRNNDRTIGPDNAGVERAGTIIIPNAPKAIGLTYPLAEMYCALDAKARESLNVSNSAGSFVCNNTGFQYLYNNPHFPSGFIHVPNNDCSNLEERSTLAVSRLAKMLQAAFDGITSGRQTIPLPTTAKEIKALRNQFRNDKCLSEFYGRTKPADKSGIWDILFTN